MAFLRKNFSSLLKTTRHQDNNRLQKSLREKIATKRSQLNVTIAILKKALEINDLEGKDKEILAHTINYMQEQGYQLVIDWYDLTGELLGWDVIPS